MLFKRKKPADAGNAQPKPQSVAGILLNPRLFATAQPLGENANIFVNLIAMIFASFGMFPRNHPAITGAPGAPSLTFAQVIGTARRSLTFTKEDLPKTLVFFAVFGSLAFGALAIFLGLLSLYVGKAHAQPVGPPAGGYFSPADTSATTPDIALEWIHYIFNGTALPNYLSQYGQAIPQSTIIQQALIVALGFYSSAILVIAGILLFYHLASMVVETAHHGVVMGKRANQIWAPIRLVVAIGLLVPIGSGLNSGQFIVIKIAEWGSGLASNTWSIFVTQLAKDNYQGVVPNTPYARKTVYDFVLMKACMCAYNAYTGNGASCGMSATPTAGTASCMPPTGLSGISPPMSVQQLPNLSDGSQKWIFDLQKPILSDNGACGHYVFNPVPQPDPGDALAVAQYDVIKNMRVNVLNDMSTEVDGFISNYVPYFIPPCAGGKGDQAFPQNNGAFEKLVVDYQNEMQQMFQTKASSDFSAAMLQAAATSSAQGWVSAGAWFNTVARAQEDLMTTDGMVPQTQGLDMPPNPNSQFHEIIPVIENFRQWLEVASPSTTPTAGGQTQQQQLMTVAAGLTQDTAGSSKNTHVMENIFSFIDWIAAYNKVWTPFTQTDADGGPLLGANGTPLTPQNFSLGVQFTGANPLAEISAFGHANINTSYDIFDAYIDYLIWSGIITTTADGGGKLLGNLIDKGLNESRIGNVFSGAGGILASMLGQTAKEAAGAISSLIGLICLLFFSSGFMMAFLLPLIPFFRFLFGILTWIVSVLEAVVCMPLVALAHLNPEGDGLAGPNGKTAYYFIFNIFLRPVMMVFGLIVSLLIFFVAASCMNLLYMLAVQGSGGLAHGHLMLSRLVYSFLYVFVLYMCANNAFKMINWLPDHAVKWMGGQSMHFQNMGDPQELAQPMTLASGYAEREIIQGAGKLGGVSAIGAKALLSGDIKAGPIMQAGRELNQTTQSAMGGGGLKAIETGINQIAAGGAGAGSPATGGATAAKGLLGSNPSTGVDSKLGTGSLNSTPEKT